MNNATAEVGAGVPPAEDTRRGVAALVRELGAAGAARFLARLGEQGGDYTAERRVFAGLSVAGRSGFCVASRHVGLHNVVGEEVRAAGESAGVLSRPNGINTRTAGPGRHQEMSRRRSPSQSNQRAERERSAHQKRNGLGRRTPGLG